MNSIMRYLFVVSLLVAPSCLCIRASRAVDLVGYVPYYRLNADYLNNVLPAQIPLLDEVRYFGLSVNGSGAITSLSGSVNSHKSNIASLKNLIEALPDAQRPRLNITLGGAGEDSVFSSVAANSALRTTLAENVTTLLNETGASSVDVDWEHPDAGAERTTNYPALLKRIKQEVGPDRRVYATVAPSVVISNSVLSGESAIDGISLMTYDLGWWGNDPSNPHDGEHSLHEYVVDTIDAWTDPTSANSRRPYVWTNASWGNAAAVDKLGVGLPFYGRNVHNGTAFTYEAIVDEGVATGDGYYTISGQTVWIPDKQTIENRVQLALEEGLQHIIIWELAQDVPPDNSASMLRIAFDKRASLTVLPGDFNGDGKVDGADLGQWQEDYGLNGESDADGDQDSDGLDFLLWQRAFGQAESPALSNVAIPEPSAAVLLLGPSAWLTTAFRLAEARLR